MFIKDFAAHDRLLPGRPASTLIAQHDAKGDCQEGSIPTAAVLLASCSSSGR